jgi:hypothetical protein
VKDCSLYPDENPVSAGSERLFTLLAYAQTPELPRIGFGLCSGTVSGAVYV